MNDTYAPPFTMTEEITNLVIEIGEQVGVVVTYDALQPNPRLRRESRIKSIPSSLAIEQNTLTLEQVSDVKNEKDVIYYQKGYLFFSHVMEGKSEYLLYLFFDQGRVRS